MKHRLHRFDGMLQRGRFIFFRVSPESEPVLSETEKKDRLGIEEDREHVQQLLDEISEWDRLIYSVESKGRANPAYIEKIQEFQEERREELRFLYRMKTGMNANTELFLKATPDDHASIQKFLDTVEAFEAGFDDASRRWYYTGKRFESYQKYELKPQLDTVIRSLKVQTPVNQELLDQALILTGEKSEKKLEIKGVRTEQFREAQSALKKGYEKILDEVRPALVAEVDRLSKARPLPSDYHDKKAGLTLLDDSIGRPMDESMLLALMVKESKLDPDAVSKSGARGLFQIMPIAEREVEKYYDYTASDIVDPVENAVVGIIYFQRCREKYANESVYSALTSANDKELLSYSIFNKGPGNLRELWKEIGDGTYENFEKSLSDAILVQLGEPVTSVKFTQEVDEAYGVMYREYAGVEAYLSPEHSAQLSQKLKINGKEMPITVGQAGEVLRYARMIDALKSAVKGVEIPIEEVARPPEVVKEGTAMIHERITLTPGQSLWSPSEKLRKQAGIWKINGFEATPAPEDHMERQAEREMLINIIIDFNNEYGLYKITDVTDLPVGVELWIPNRTYIESWIQRVNAEEESAAQIQKVEERVIQETPEQERPTERVLPREVPFEKRAYVDASLESAGLEILQNTDRLPIDKVEKVPTGGPKKEVIYENPHGLRDFQKNRTETTHIILHSTNADQRYSTEERGLSGVLTKYKAHYVVSREGIIYLVRDPKDNMDHAGRSTNQTASKAKWDGDGFINDKSIGIEVATYAGEEWNEAQYEAVRQLVHALGEKYQIPAKNVLTHSQVAYGRTSTGSYRFTKPDPLNVEWDRLDLPNNYLLIDYDVLGGMEANWDKISRSDDFVNVDQDVMFAGVRASEKLAKDPEYQRQMAQVQTEALERWKEEVDREAEIVKYVVKKGDTLTRIATGHETTVTVIQKYNGLSSTRLRIGQELLIPKGYR